MTVEGAKSNYGVIMNADTLELDEMATETLRSDAEKAEAGKELPTYDRGGSMDELIRSCKDETGFEPPTPQWDEEVYGPTCRGALREGLVCEGQRDRVQDVGRVSFGAGHVSRIDVYVPRVREHSWR